MARTVVVLVCLLLGLCSCARPEGSALPSVDPSAVPTATPTHEALPDEPEPPRALKRSGPKGAAAFVEYYWAIYNHARRTGDQVTLRRLGTSECGSCELTLAGVRAVYDAGGQIRGGRIDHQTDSVTPAASAKDGTQRFTVRSATRTRPARVVGSDGSTERVPESRAFITFLVEHRDGAWRAVSWHQS